MRAFFRPEFARSERVLVNCPPEEDRAVQSDRHETDINAIIARFRSTGVAPAARGRPVFGEWSDAYDLRTVFEVQLAARDSFAQLPAEVRARFGNDPVRLAQFLSDSRNREEAVKLGLLKAVEPPSKPAVASKPAGEGSSPSGSG